MKAKKAVKKVARYTAHRARMRGKGFRLVQVWLGPEDMDDLAALEALYPSLTRGQVIALALRVKALHDAAHAV